MNNFTRFLIVGKLAISHRCSYDCLFDRHRVISTWSHICPWWAVSGNVSLLFMSANPSFLNYVWGLDLAFELSSWRVSVRCAGFKLWGILFFSTNPLFLPSLSFSLRLSRFHSSSCFFALSVSALFNISSYVSDTFAKISWSAREKQGDSQLYLAYVNNCKLLFLSQPLVNIDRRLMAYHM